MQPSYLSLYIRSARSDEEAAHRRPASAEAFAVGEGAPGGPEGAGRTPTAADPAAGLRAGETSRDPWPGKVACPHCGAPAVLVRAEQRSEGHVVVQKHLEGVHCKRPPVKVRPGPCERPTARSRPQR